MKMLISFLSFTFFFQQPVPPSSKLPPPTSLLTPAICGKGSFSFWLGDQTIGREDFEIRCEQGGYSASGHTSLKTPAGNLDLNTTLAVDKSGAPVSSTAKGQTNFADGRSPSPQLRIALIGFAGRKPTGGSDFLQRALAEAVSRDPRVALIDQSIIQPALAGVGYSGSINMNKDEARRLGAAVGCDFLISGKTEVLTRSEREGESHEEAFAGVVVIDARTGALAVFDFISEKAATRDAALSGLIKTLSSHSASYIARMIEVRAALSGSVGENRDAGPAEIIEDLPDEGSPRAIGFQAPEFLNRVKPEFTSEAEQADIAATVEVMVVFRSTGEIGSMEVSRWAGFGLDQSAERAIRQLKFKPATRDGKPVNVRALIRYNFRRVSEAAAKPEPPAPQLPDKPERDLRKLFKPSYRRP